MTKDALLWIPGLGCDADYFADIQAELPPDQRGSIVDISAAETLQEMAECVLEHIIGPTIVVGASMGGWIAQVVAASASDRISTLVLITTWARYRPELELYLNKALALMDAGPLAPEVVRQATRQSFNPGAVTDEQIDRMMAMSERVGVEITRTQIDAVLAEPDVSATHADIKVPALVIGAKHDQLIDPSESQYLADALPGSRLTMLDAGHACGWERPKQIADEMVRWIETPNP